MRVLVVAGSLILVVTRHVLRELRASYHVLMVDDGPTNQAVTKRLLESRGHSVTLA